MNSKGMPPPTSERLIGGSFPFQIFEAVPQGHFIGGSDARIIMGDDETALLRLWREKRGEVEREDLAGNLIVQLGIVTEHLNRHWYERITGQVVTEVQRKVFHPIKRWMAATVDGMVEGTGAVFEAKFMLPWTSSEEGAAEKHMSQLEHNMWVMASRTAVLSIITGGGKWVEMTITDVSQIAPKRAQRIKSKPKKSALQRGACNDPYPSEPTIPQPQGEGKGYPEIASLRLRT